MLLYIYIYIHYVDLRESFGLPKNIIHHPKLAETLPFRPEARCDLFVRGKTAKDALDYLQVPSIKIHTDVIYPLGMTNSDLMGFYSDSMAFYSDLMGY